MPSVESASSTKPVCVYEDKAINGTTARTRRTVSSHVCTLYREVKGLGSMESRSVQF